MTNAVYSVSGAVQISTNSIQITNPTMKVGDVAWCNGSPIGIVMDTKNSSDGMVTVLLNSYYAKIKQAEGELPVFNRRPIK